MNKQEYAKQFGRWINNDEIVFDYDHREQGFQGVNFTAINLYRAGYKFEVYYAEGQKSPHLHVKNIKGLEKLDSEQLRKYKKLFMKKYSPGEFLNYLDIQLTTKHRIAEENKLHYKYQTIKKLLSVFNEDKENFVEGYLFEEAKKQRKVEVKINPEAFLLKDKIPITAIAQKFNLKIKGNMAICPFHNDKNPSLSLSNKKGLFYCFGCGVKGDLITFYKMLRELQDEKKTS